MRLPGCLSAPDESPAPAPPAIAVSAGSRTPAADHHIAACNAAPWLGRHTPDAGQRSSASLASLLAPRWLACAPTSQGFEPTNRARPRRRPSSRLAAARASSNSCSAIQYTAGGLHCDDVHAAGLEPVGQAMQIGGEAGELAHRLVVAIRWHGHEMRGAADLDAGGVGVSQCQGMPGLARLQAGRRLRWAEACSIIGWAMWRRIGYVVVLTLSNALSPRRLCTAATIHQCR